MTPLVSVLMPVLNEERSLAATVASVLAQEGCDLEVLVIDGRSADRTAPVAAELARRDPRVRLLSNPEVTIPAGLNVGLRSARGGYVARVDGHAEVRPGYFATALERLAVEPAMAGVGGRRVGVAATPVGRAIGLVLSSPYGVGNSVNHYGTRAQLTDHASFGVYRVEAARSVGGWDEGLLVNEDVDFDFRLLEAGHTIGYDPAMLVRWQMRERLPDLFRQFRRYGRGKAAMVRKNGPAAVRARHLAPPVAVVGGTGLLLASLRRPEALLGLVPYAAVVAFASARAWRSADRDPDTSLAALPAAFVATHVAWGLGFLEGLVLARAPRLASGSATTQVPEGSASGSSSRSGGRV